MVVVSEIGVFKVMITSVDLDQVPSTMGGIMPFIIALAILTVIAIIIDLVYNRVMFHRAREDANGGCFNSPKRSLRVSRGFVITSLVVLAIATFGLGMKNSSSQYEAHRSFVAQEYGLVDNPEFPTKSSQRKGKPLALLDVMQKDGTVISEVFVYKTGNTVTMKRPVTRDQIEADPTGTLDYGDLIEITQPVR